MEQDRWAKDRASEESRAVAVGTRSAGAKAIAGGAAGATRPPAARRTAKVRMADAHRAASKPRNKFTQIAAVPCRVYGTAKRSFLPQDKEARP